MTLQDVLFAFNMPPLYFCCRLWPICWRPGLQQHWSLLWWLGWELWRWRYWRQHLVPGVWSLPRKISEGETDCCQGKGSLLLQGWPLKKYVYVYMCVYIYMCVCVCVCVCVCIYSIYTVKALLSGINGTADMPDTWKCRILEVKLVNITNWSHSPYTSCKYFISFLS